MRYASILFVVIFCLSCTGVAVSGTDVGPEKMMTEDISLHTKTNITIRGH